MRRHSALVTAAAGAALFTALLTGAGAAATGSSAGAAARPALVSWGTAEEVPGTAALNSGGHAGIAAMSCPTTGNCGAGGSYTDSAAHQQALVVNETGGTWGGAREVPGIAALNGGGHAGITAMSCPTAGNCGAGGIYTDSSAHQQAFVVSETGGTWGSAREVPGTAALNADGPAAITTVSCGAAGDCSAGGYYTDGSGKQQAFVVGESGGTWHTAKEVPGTAALNQGGRAQISSVSCPAAGTCSAGGFYSSSAVDGIPVVQAFVINESGGTWHTAKEVPGTAALNSGGFAAINAVSCASAGKCSAGGEYTDSTPATQAFVVTETGGTWGTAQEVPGTAALNASGLAQISAVSCPSAGNCGAGGFYMDASFASQAFVVGQSGGTWGTAREVPGTAALNQGTGPGAAVNALSCASAGTCGAGGPYTDASGRNEGYVDSETGGTWGTAEEVPGIAALNAGGRAATTSVSCAPGGLCAAGGNYNDSAGHQQAFVVSQTSRTR